MSQLDDVLKAFRSGSLSASQALEQLKSARPLLPPYPLSEGQRGLWVLEKSAAGESGYNVPVAFRVRGALSLEHLRAACELIWAQHPVLRTVIEEVDGVLQQRVAPLTPVPWHVETQAPVEEAAFLAYLRQQAKAPFSLERGPLLRLSIFVRQPDEYVVLFVIHHLVFDGTSLGALLRTLLDAYAKLQRGERVLPELLPATYRDFVQWERAMLDGAEGQAHRAYWQQQLAGPLPVLELPTDFPRASHAQVAGRTHALALSAERTQQLRALSAEHGLSMGVLLLGVYELLLHRYSGETDLVVGMPTAGRPQSRFDQLIGYFVNVIALRHRVAANAPFVEWARSLQRTLIEGLDHSEYPFSKVVSDLRSERRAPRAAVFQVAFEYQNASMLTPGGLRAASPYGLSFEPVAGLHQEGEYELVLEVVEREADLALHFKYDAKLYAEATIVRMADSFVGLLAQIAEQPARPLSAYAPLTAADAKNVLQTWNATEADYPRDRGLHELFAEQARRTPDALAMAFEDQRLTYRELYERSDALARRLVHEGVQPGDRVALCVERSLDLPIGLLGILAAGAAYVPLDPAYPRDRVSYMLEDSGAQVVVTQGELLLKTRALAELLAVSGVSIVDLDEDLGSFRRARLPAPARGDDLAYVMYTSGSTGKPKGVMISHRALVNFLVSMAKEPGLTAADRLLAVTTYSFDISGLELYLPLLVGAACHVCSAEKARDPKRLAAEIYRVRPTVMQATPTTWTMLVQIGWENREGVTVLCGGEALPQTLRQHFVQRGWQAWNLYGPTETTIWSTVEQITSSEGGSIGRPIANTQIYILDAYGQPCPVLVPGELCIAGDGLARGYFNKPELTAEKFVDNPFRSGEKMYRTGDVASWRADGTIEYLGRGDGQVKVRGHRIELGEIEARLVAHPQISSCAVVVCELQGHKHLTAGCVVEQGAGRLDLSSASSVRALREHLQAGLPDYMVPSRFLEVTELPLTPNGKIDRKRLAQLAAAKLSEVAATLEPSEQPAAAPAAPATPILEEHAEIVERVRALWQRALSVSGVGLDDGFFDLGGDSVMAVSVAARIEREFGCAFGATEMFRFGTIRQISRHLGSLLQPAPHAAQATRASAPRTVAPAAAAVSDDDYRDCIAIIGISAQLPGAGDHRQFWDNLVNGVESVHRLSPEELRRAGVPASTLANPSYVPVQSVIDGKHFFDAEFFKVSPRDATLMDPQLRLLLQHSWKAVEDAGYAPRSIPETSVWVASSHSGYAARAIAARSAGGTSEGTGEALLGSDEQYVGWLLAQSGTIPTIISHRLGFKGGSQAVHTNCSSSLVALSSAYRSLISGETRYAMVGAATVFAHDSLGYVHQPGLNFSSDGHVRTFDAAADGMIGGEGVAVVLLKRAAEAIADGDHVYALIRGVAINNDGADKAGFYAPSVEGQTDVILKAMRTANVDARSIGYVEAHGTGTSLGDPIEVAAISAAYRRTTSDKQFCGLGSVKTNIGHVDTAAGLAGLIKVAMSLEHRELPPSLHFREPNPRLGLDESPFYVVAERTAWAQERGARRAAISSFGIGGTNAHAILEESPPAPVAADAAVAAAELPALIVLSARTAEQLRERAAQLFAHLASSQSKASLFDLAFTLQVGREAMEHRLAFTAASRDALRDTLRAFVDGDAATAATSLYRGEATKEKDTWGALTGDAEFAETVDKWMQRGKYKRLLELWAKGLPVDWAKLYAAGGTFAHLRPRRVSLPGYPFAKQRFWIDAAPARSSGEASALHPLLHRNTSILEEQRFTSTFRGDEFFLRDHVVNGKQVLPAVCYLEMARVAMERSSSSGGSVVLQDVVWMRPVVVDGSKDVHVSLQQRDDGEVEFKISSDAETTHAQGRAVLVEPGDATAAEPIDLDALRARCSESLDGALSYATFTSVGVSYGPAHQGLTQIHAGLDEDGQPFALAHVTLPASLRDSRAPYVLHPTVLDCALQATIGLALLDKSGAGPKPSLPFGLTRLEIFERSPDASWIVVRPGEEPSPGGSLRRLDIDVCDEQGRVCVRLSGFASRAIAGELETAAAAPSSSGEMLLAPIWEAQQLPDDASWWPSLASRVVLIGGDAAQQEAWRKRFPALQIIELAPSVDDIAARLTACGDIEHLVWLAPSGMPASAGDESLIADQEAGVIGVFRLIKALLQLGYGARPLGITAVTWRCQRTNLELFDPTHASVHGLIGSLAKEYERWQVRLIDADELPVEEALNVPADPNGDAWAYRNGEWLRQQLVSVELEPARGVPYRRHGVYVVIGGAGGLGEVFTEHVVRAHQAQVIWLGRSAKSPAIEAKIRRLAELGPAPLYLQCDATDRASLEAAYAQIKEQHDQIHGLVHAAIVLADKSLAQMEEDRFRQSLSAKVDVSVRMAQVFSSESLDFVLFFSSLQSFSKAAGQSNYAAGCTFKDAFASRYDHERAGQVRVMNWSYWGSVGVVASDSYRARMAQLGFGSIEPDEGMAALHRLFAGPLLQNVFLKTTKPQAVPVSERLLWAPHQAPPAFHKLSDETQRELVIPQATDATSAAEAVAAFHRMLEQLLLVQLRSLGLLLDPSIKAWAARLGLPSILDRWLEESLRVLEASGYVRRFGRGFTEGRVQIADATAWSEWEAHCRSWAHDPSVSAQLRLVDATLRALPDILRNDLRATDVMFPNSSMAMVEGIYKHNPIPDYFNAVLTDSLLEYVAARTTPEPSAKLRILEIGAGTGGTSAGIFKRLRPFAESIAEYCYTDLSRAFLMHAEKEYGPIAPYLTYRIFNAEKPVEEQGLELGSFDVVIATNVLHATRNIRHTLRGAKALLKRDGVLFINEMSRNSLFSHLTFGLLEGWWLYDDESLRVQGSPVLAPETWERVLVEERFPFVKFPARAWHEHGQQVIIAESDGLIRQPLRPASAAPVPVPAAPVAVKPVRKPDVASAPAKPVAAPSAASLRDRLTSALKQLVADTIRTPVAQIDERAALENYGMDSILAVKLTNSLKEHFPDVSSTLFFEHQSIAAVVAHLLQRDERGVIRWVGEAAAPVAEVAEIAAPVAAKPAALVVRAAPTSSRRRTSPAPAPAPRSAAASNPGIAIIGMSGRYPDAKNVAEYWENLKAGKNCIREIPADRWDHSRYFDPQKGKPNKSYSKWGGFIEGIDLFDPLFFRISPQEAEQIDPQERVFIQEAYASLEDAGYTPASLCASRKVGVYVGVMNSTYRQHSAYWSIANRVSYLFDFQGPSMALDTACSSSLTAIHLAVEAILGGSCEVAIAGGVNLIVEPIQYTNLSAMTMLSASDQCKAFGAGADGFVDGEGAGAVVLKPLDRAIADGDHIYGVIRGSAVNAGGKTNGFTVPNPVAQREVIQRALASANLDARAISYIEAHGTGTELGDPIEITGLTQAFAAHTSDKQFCAIGSVKSNIGHLESAAGVASVTKVLLQMQHRALVPSLHSQTLNPHIDFARTPFQVQHTVSEWRRPTITVDGERRELPRIAGVSSFGAGGANAHLILEEYEAPSLVAAPKPPASSLILLSAKGEAQLQDRARQLLAHAAAELELPRVAYTLQVGREAMDHRLAFVAANPAELRSQLTAYLAGRGDALHAGRVRRDNAALAQFASDEDMQSAAAQLLRDGQLDQLLALWVKGLRVDWAALYAAGARPLRTSLPTYPFAKERYWKEPEAAPAAAASERALHPLLQRNTSNLSETRFSSTLRGDAFFLADHVINGQRILPGVAYLEMARAALAVSLDLQAAATPLVELRDLVWLRPLAVSEPKDVHVKLRTVEDDEIEYEIYTGPAVLSGEDAVHSRGRAVRPAEVEWVEPVDVESLRARCDRSLEVAACYAAFDAMGIAYGLSHRGLLSVQAGEDEHGPFVLAQVKLPDCVSDTRDAYVLHPSVLDSALQAAVGLSLLDGDVDAAAPPRPVLPFALDRLQLLNRTPKLGWVVMRPTTEAGAQLQKLDIDLCEDSGHVCVRLHGFTSRVADDPRARRREISTVLLEPTWQEQPLSAVTPGAPVAYGERWVFLADAFKARALTGNVVNLPSDWLAAGEQVLERVRAILQAKPSGDVLVQVVLSDEPTAELGGALAAFLKSAQQENPRLFGQVLTLARASSADEITRALRDNEASREQEIRYASGARQALTWKEMASRANGKGNSSPWRDGGVYLITGGAGGLGLVFAQEILDKSPGAKLILTGRSPLTAERRAALEALHNTEYRVLDVSDASAVEACVAEILRHYGALHGVLHCAGVTRDAFLLNKNVDELRAVWAPKVTGAVNLDRATKDVGLDLFLLFSSISGVFGNVGQSDYAFANAAMDRFAAARATRSGRSGHTLTINWPLWESGGMAMDEATRATLRQRGLDALTTAAGLEAFYRAWASHAPQVLVLAGDRHKLAQLVVAPKAPVVQVAASAPASDELRDAVLRDVRQRVATMLKLAPERIETDASFDQYGLDSILALKIVAQLEPLVGSLPKTLLFEHQTVEALAAYLLKSHRAALIAHLKLPTAAPAPAPAAKPRLAPRAKPAPAPRAPTATAPTTDIAVIGLAGRYPGADDIHELWDNLRAGLDCITEVPAYRWDHSKFYDATRGTPGKTACNWGGFIRGTDTFDHDFFRIAAQDASHMDPQERVLLEVMWHLLEDAGHTPQLLRTRHQRNVGVYVGGHSFVEAGASTAYTASRLSEFLGLRGPSFVVDTFSASSATALHLACQGLLAGDCQLAIAAGVCVLHPQILVGSDPWLSTREDRRGFSTDGGFLFAEAANAVLLKPLADAVRDSDKILAVIKATALDSSGRAKRQFPSDPAVMANVIRQSLDKARVSARSIGCVEPAVSGASANDYTEVSAYTAVFRESTPDVGFCAMGTVESNVGHSIAPSGLAQLTKAILQLHHGERVPTIKMDPVNPELELEQSPFFLPRATAAWPRPSDSPRRALVTSRGADGTQVAVVVEEYQAPPERSEEMDGTPERLFLLSAASPDRLSAVASALNDHLHTHPTIDLRDLAYTLNHRREELPHRLAVVAATADELSTHLAAFLESEPATARAGDHPRWSVGDAVTGRASLRQLLDEAAESRLLSMYVGDNDLEKLGRYWVSGSDVRAAGFGDSSSGRVAALPLYPFASTRVTAAEPIKPREPNPVAAGRNGRDVTQKSGQVVRSDES